jgi:hypothetical protein
MFRASERTGCFLVNSSVTPPALLLTVGQQHLLTTPADLLSLGFEARQHLKSVRNFISAVSANVRGACRLFLWCAFKDPGEFRLDHPIILVCALGKNR